MCAGALRAGEDSTHLWPQPRPRGWYIGSCTTAPQDTCQAAAAEPTGRGDSQAAGTLGHGTSSTHTQATGGHRSETTRCHARQRKPSEGSSLAPSPHLPRYNVWRLPQIQRYNPKPKQGCSQTSGARTKHMPQMSAASLFAACRVSASSALVALLRLEGPCSSSSLRSHCTLHAGLAAAADASPGENGDCEFYIDTSQINYIIRV